MLRNRNVLLFSKDQLFVSTLRNVVTHPQSKRNEIVLLNHSYPKDDYTNITPRISSRLGHNIYLQKYHPLSFLRQRIISYLYQNFVNSRGNPIFSVQDNLPQVVSVHQNFDSLLIPEDHPSRLKNDCYYVNKNYLLRAHMTAYQNDLLLSGLNNFVIIGDVYRRDQIDKTHYPVFHQLDTVRLKTREELFPKKKLQIFEDGNNTAFTGTQEKQSCHTLEAVKLMEHELKNTLGGLANNLLGDVQYRWVDAQFPFTLPSWELEIFHNNTWVEMLGCGIMRQPILANAGITDRIGWAFGLGLERWAMILYNIPDIRLFWSKDTGFVNQFKTENINKNITYVPISQYPQCINDMSFWLPEKEFSNNDFYDVVRNVGGDIIEQVSLIDIFQHPKTGKVSRCYRIVYRHMNKTLSQAEVNIVHEKIANNVIQMGAVLR